MARYLKGAKARENRTFSLAIGTMARLAALATGVELALGVQCSTGRIIDLLAREATAERVVEVLRNAAVAPEASGAE